MYVFEGIFISQLQSVKLKWSASAKIQPKATAPEQDWRYGKAVGSLVIHCLAFHSLVIWLQCLTLRKASQSYWERSPTDGDSMYNYQVFFHCLVSFEFNEQPARFYSIGSYPLTSSLNLKEYKTATSFHLEFKWGQQKD